MLSFSLYHYPRVYFTRIEPYDRFIYYRPLGKSARRQDSRHYFGHGVISQPFADPHRDDHRFAPLIRVGFRDVANDFYETESTIAPHVQAAVCRISEMAYYRILAEARVTATATVALPSTEDVSAFYLPKSVGQRPVMHFGASSASHRAPATCHKRQSSTSTNRPRDRSAHEQITNVFSDFVAKRVHQRGGVCEYNNNVDLFADFGAATNDMDRRRPRAERRRLHRACVARFCRSTTQGDDRRCFGELKICQATLPQTHLLMRKRPIIYQFARMNLDEVVVATTTPSRSTFIRFSRVRLRS